MLRALIGSGLVAACLASACTLPRRPVVLMVSTSGQVPARIEVRLKQGAVRPLECPAPCNFRLSEEAEADLSLTADGYFPVVLPLSHSMLWSGSEVVPLVIPLLKKGK